MLLHSLRFFLQFLWSATRGMRGRVALAVCAQGAGLATALTTPLILRAAVDRLSDTADTPSGPLPWLVLYGVFWTLAECLPKLQHVVLVSVLETIEQAAQREYLRHLLAHPPRYHATHKAGSQLAQLKRIEQAIPAGVIGLFWTIIPTCAQIFFATGVVFVMFDAKYAAILFFCLVGYLLSTFLTTGRATELQREQIKRVDAAEHGVLDLLNNMETVKAYARENDEVARQDRLIDARREGNVRIAWHMEKLGLAQLSFLGVGVLVMTMVAGLDVVGKQLSIGDFVLLNAYLLQFSLPASYFAYSVRETRQALVGLEPFEALLNSTEREEDEALSPALNVAPRIEFRDVSLRYPDRATHAALDHVSLVIEPGQVCALVGATGSGKSSVLKLLARFEEADSGTIRVDGRALDTVAPRAWRASIAYANQHAQLFDRTIRENLEYGWTAPANRPDDELAVQRMIDHLRLDTVVARCPEGLDTPVGAAANRLSGGERQRLNVGRALLAEAPLLLLDEPTSALDAHTEAQIHRLIADTHGAATRLIVAHRLETIADADLILVFDQGKVIERGTHTQLLASNGHYAALWRKALSAQAPRSQTLPEALHARVAGSGPLDVEIAARDTMREPVKFDE